MSALQVVDFAGWHIARAGFEDGVPRIQDLELARKLGFKDPRNIRALIAQLIRAGNLNDVAIVCGSRRNPGKAGRPTKKEYWLTEEQALFVVARSETPKATELLKAIITVFLAVKREAQRAQFRSAFLEARLLEFDKRRKWERLWEDEVVTEICKLYRWPTTNANGTMYAPLAGVMDRVYRLLLGDAVVNEIKRRNPKPSKGKNHHQLLQDQSASPKQWWAKLRSHFLRAPYQLEMG